MNATELLKRFQRRFSVLIVDDDPAVVLILNKMLGSEFDVRFALSGRDALRLVQESQPDLVLLDIDMPEMSGIEVCRHLRAEPTFEATPVIFITSHNDADSEVEALNAGGSDFIAKPLNQVVVVARIRLHLKLKLQHDVLNDFVYIDGLTGVGNRRKLDEALDAEWRHCRRSGLPLALMMIDIDHFKLYNDHYGHGQGDQCLQAVAQAIRGGFNRPHDVVARYGGEEFACLMPETDLHAALGKAAATLEAIQSLHLPHAVSPIAPEVSVSIGVAVLIPNGPHFEILMEEADRALYDAKHEGRNRVCPPLPIHSV